jgi:sigma-B regulation protein RsbU (phosphoserine phosphatase)
MQLAKDRASLFYGVVDRRTFELHYCLLGSNLALVIDGQTGKMKALKGSSSPLAKGMALEIVGHRISLSPRDRLLIVSEGLIKTMNPAGEAFGLDRLTQAIMRAPSSGVHELRNEILYQLEKFAESTDFPEDVTVIVTEVKDKILKLAKS